MNKHVGAFILLVMAAADIGAATITTKFDTQADWLSCQMQHADPYILPGSVKILQNYSDDFSGSTLDAHWMWDNGGKTTNTYAFDTVPGSISLAGDPVIEWWDTTDTAPKIFQRTDGDFEIETCCAWINDTKHNSASAGLFVKQDSGNWLDIEMYTDSLDFYIRTNQTTSQVSGLQRSTIIVGSPKPLFMKIVKQSNNYETFYKWNAGDAWTSHQSIAAVDYYRVDAGIYFKDTTISAYSLFDYVNFYHAVTNTSCVVTSPPIDLGRVPLTTGYISWEQDVTVPGTRIDMQTETSPDTVAWSGRSGVYTGAAGSAITSPQNRYIRFIATLRGTDSASPALGSVTIQYPAGDLNILDSRTVPNPVATGTLVIECRYTGNAQSLSVELFAASGKKIRAVTGLPTDGSRLAIDVSDLANGAYFYRLTVRGADGAEKTTIKKFVMLR